MNLFGQIINGLSVGSIYALIALGYSMVYGIVKLINFAHGDIIMVGAYLIYLLLTVLGLPLWLAMLGAIGLSALIGILIERIAYDRLLSKNAPRISLLITAIGVSILLQNLAQLVFTSSGKSLPSFFPRKSFETAGTQVSLVTLITILTTLVVMLILQILVRKTKIGKAMRATSEDAGAAKLMGINTKVTIAFTFGVGSAIAAIGSILYCATYPMITPYIGGMMGLKAFVAAVLGGIGSIPGAMIGGYILGLVESLTTGFGLSMISDAIVFAILIVVLIVKPTGLLGKNVSEKV